MGSARIRELKSGDQYRDFEDRRCISVDELLVFVQGLKYDKDRFRRIKVVFPERKDCREMCVMAARPFYYPNMIIGFAGTLLKIRSSAEQLNSTDVLRA